MPEEEDLPEFQALDAYNQSVFLDTCYNVRMSVSRAFNYEIDEQCRKQTILINAALFNGTLGKGIAVCNDCNCINFVEWDCEILCVICLPLLYFE